MRKFTSWVAAALLLGWVTSADAELWRYEDASGAVSFTDSLDNVPPEFRHTARRHTIQEHQTQPDNATSTVEDIKAERRRIIATFSTEQAKAALHKGLLTEEEVGLLVDRGALRLTEVGDSVRFAKRPEQVMADRAAKAQANTARLEDADTRMLRELAGMQSGRGAQIEMVKQAAESSFDPDKIKHSMMGTGALAVLMIIVYPFILRKYNDDGTRRIIRMSFMFSFTIIVSTGNFVLFRDDIVRLLGFKQGIASAAGASTPQPQKIEPAQFLR
jgi:hypothetical protein